MRRLLAVFVYLALVVVQAQKLTEDAEATFACDDELCVPQISRAKRQMFCGLTAKKIPMVGTVVNAYSVTFIHLDGKSCRDKNNMHITIFGPLSRGKYSFLHGDTCQNATEKIVDFSIETFLPITGAKVLTTPRIKENLNDFKKIVLVKSPNTSPLACSIHQ